MSGKTLLVLVGVAASVAVLVVAVFLLQGGGSSGDTSQLSATTTSVRPNMDAETRTLNDTVVDFNTCLQDTRRYDERTGSTTVEVFGVVGSDCVIKFGSQQENPNNSGLLDTICYVPRSLGIDHRYAGFNIDAIADHCQAL